MLYEVITYEEIRSAMALVQDSLLCYFSGGPSCKDFLTLKGEVDDKEEAARITSYNVCYTKLLRRVRLQRVLRRDRDARGMRPAPQTPQALQGPRRLRRERLVRSPAPDLRAGPFASPFPTIGREYFDMDVRRSPRITAR